MASVSFSCGFSPVSCNFFRKSTQKKGEALLKHIFNVKETHSNLKEEILISGKCVRQASVSKQPYNFELTLDKTRNVTSALCSCVAGVQGKCKHLAAAVAYVNSEREESPTDRQCSWQNPSSRGKYLYPKGETIDNILQTPFPTPKLEFSEPNQEEIIQQIALMEKHNLKSSMLYIDIQKPNHLASNLFMTI